jgi:hypothetical protein
MDHGYPADEVRPLSCDKYERVPDVLDIHRNDVLGNYSVTFLDTITTFAIFGDVDRFERYIEMLRNLTFDLDSTVQVFETSIRALGSLLSAHLYASDKFNLPSYDGFLLVKAYELGLRLIKAYMESNHGIPVARVNLRTGSKGLPKELIEETCTAGAGSPMLELTLLSILTNDTVFEDVSRTAFVTLWNGRSALDLVPMSLNPLKGKWVNGLTGVGASIDSFYEYALKGAILFDDSELMVIWSKAYKALATHSRLSWFMTNVHTDTGMIATAWIDSLSAFFPGLLVLAGKVRDAHMLYQPFLKLWNKYGGIPERWDFLATDIKNQVMMAQQEVISLEWYPLRPEFIESTYYLYRATRDPVYLRIGEQILHDYNTTFKAPCGFAGYRDIRTGELQDRMESFVLSETFMYLYLLFDDDNDLHKNEKMVFSTEGHPIWLPSGVLPQYKRFKSDTLIQSGLLVEDRSQSNESERTWDEKVVGFIKSLLDSNEIEEASAPFDTAVLDSYGECDIPPQSGFYSRYLSDISSFEVDAKFKEQFRGMKSMETSAPFYSIFAPPNGFCSREAETSFLAFNFGDLSQVKECDLKITGDDIIAMTLKGVVLRLELLKLGQIDSTNTLIDNDFLQQYSTTGLYDVRGTCTLEDEMFANSVFRVKSVNGVEMSPDGSFDVLYVDRGIETSSSGMLEVVNDVQLMIKGVLITNLRIMNLT